MKQQPKIQFYLPPKLEPFLTKRKRYKIAAGGRGSGKSMTVADLLLFLVAQHGLKISCMREFQSSIDDSSYALLVEEINRLKIPGFAPKKAYIPHQSGGTFKFKGLARSIQAIKSMQGFHIFAIEEAQFLSDESIQMLTPTLREAGSEIWMCMNPGSQEDPVSKRFLNPYWDELQQKGFYEDDMHYIVLINYCDNEKFPGVLEQERQNDYKLLPRALYDHIWMGEFNDFVENGLITREEFDACIDAHEKLGFEPRGLKYASHDPSDEGPDSKGFAFRHGSVVLDVQEKLDGKVDAGADWAADLAIDYGVDAYTWDADGMGAALNRQISESFEGKHTKLSQFRGSKGVDFPDEIFQPARKAVVANQRMNRDALKNRRAQYYAMLQQRICNTYRAVAHGKYMDPDKMISFSSKIPVLKKLRSELCKMPIKPNGSGLFELYTKEDMKKKFKFKSPNLADSVMMLMRMPPMDPAPVKIPDPIRVMGQRGNMSPAFMGPTHGGVVIPRPIGRMF